MTSILEVTRMPIYTNALGSVPTQYFFLSEYLMPTLFSFFFLSVFHSIFFTLPSPFLSFCFVDFTFFSLLLFFFLSFLPIIFPIVFSPPSSPFYLVCPTNHLKCLTNHLKCLATFENGRTHCTGIQKTYI